MAWTDEQWGTFAAILQRGFAAKDPFTAADGNVYRLLLDGVDPEAAMRAVRAIVLDGQELRPKPGAIVERIRRDAGQPTFDEAYRLIFGPGGILAAQPSREALMRYGTPSDRRQLVDRAAADRAAQMHPLVGAFVARQGLDRLRALNVDDSEYGALRRRELRVAWTEHVDACDDRVIAVLAAGGRTGMRELDPMVAVKQIDPGRAAELEAATTSTSEGTGS